MTARLRSESGQALVLGVVSAAVIVALVMLLVDAGGWMQAQRRAQSVADASALAAAPQLLDQPPDAVGAIAVNFAQTQFGVALQPPSVSATAIDVVAKPPVTGVLSPFGRMFGVQPSASATARIQVPTALAAVVPLVVVCSGCRPGPWSQSSWSDGTSRTFVFHANADPNANTLSPVALPGAGIDGSNFRQYVTCDASAPTSSSCEQTRLDASGYWQPLCLRSRGASCNDANRVASGLRAAADGRRHVVAVADGYCGDCARTSGFHVVGWAAATFSNVMRTGQNVQVQASFAPLLVSGKWLDPSTSGNPYDFGVRAIALTE